MRALFLILIFFTTQIHMSAKNRISIIPEPLSVEILQGFFPLDGETGLVLFGTAAYRNPADFLKRYTERYYGIRLKETAKGREKWIGLKIEDSAGSKIGAYEVLVTPGKVSITGYRLFCSFCRLYRAVEWGEALNLWKSPVSW